MLFYADLTPWGIAKQLVRALCGGRTINGQLIYGPDPGDSSTARACTHCSRRIDIATPLAYAVYLAGFCSRLCQENHAVSQVARGEAWWLKTGAR